MFATRCLRSAAARLAPRSTRGFASGAVAGIKPGGFPTHITTLGNGLRVASERTPVGETATVGVWVDTGSRYETEQNNGVAHFTEHMFFKGTARRPKAQLEGEVEDIGGHLNAYTSREQTVFFAKVFKKDVPQAMDILADILQNSEFNPSMINAERSTILREMEEVEKNFEENVYDRLHYTAFRGTPLARNILGPVENIESESAINQQTIKDYVATHYTAPRMVIAGAGDIEHEQLVQLSQKLFGQLPSTPRNGIQPVLLPARFTGSDIRQREDDMKTAHVAYGFPTAGWNDGENTALMLIQSMIGSWSKGQTGGKHSSSDLIADVAKDALAVNITAFNTQYSDAGLFGIYAEAEEKALDELMYKVTKFMTDFCYHVDPYLLAEAKNRLKMSMLATLDGTTGVCEEIGRQLLTHGRRVPIEEMLARIEACDAKAVRSAAMHYFNDRDFALAAIGPIYELPDYNWLRRRTYSLRW